MLIVYFIRLTIIRPNNFKVIYNFSNICSKMKNNIFLTSEFYMEFCIIFVNYGSNWFIKTKIVVLYVMFFVIKNCLIIAYMNI